MACGCAGQWPDETDRSVRHAVLRLAMRRLLLLAAMAGAPLGAEPVVTSDGPGKVGVTIYRAPERGPGEAMDRDWLQGYALVTETREVSLPAGKATLRFEGVAAGMLPESALVSGLPAGVREKNLDAELLSPRNLYARAFGRPVTLRRANLKTGAVREERAVIRSGPDGATIVQTQAGFEAVDCGPTSDDLVHDGVPDGLSARPTLSVETEAPAPVKATVTLSYLAWGFDWQADYVVHLRRDGRAAVLGWVTLASSDSTGFADADTAVVGGKVNREDSAPEPRQAEELVMHCFFRPPPAPLVMAPPMPAPAPMAADIVVTGQRRTEAMQSAPFTVTAAEESLGDLRLYRVPVPTTVAARAQKQVALFQLDGVKVQAVYRSDLWVEGAGEAAATRLLRLRNRKADGLGRALPAGKVAVFEDAGGRSMLAGEGPLRDLAVDEDADVRIGPAPPVTASQVVGVAGARVLTVRNANPFAVRYEAALRHDPRRRIDSASAALVRDKGEDLWRAMIPANAVRTLRYRLSEPR
ncbi:MAG: hypothetical protein KGN34_02385 [Sphingomonadales bacterium]|nr:hypothetical protein [Sphingomonadales bacterium]